MKTTAIKPLPEISGTLRIDIHSHFIPDIDDGPDEGNLSLEMLKMARADGTGVIVATPHVNSSFCRYRDLEGMARRLDDFRERLGSTEDIPEVRFGSEIYLTSELPILLRDYGELLALNGSTYVLVEFPLDILFPHSRDLLSQVMMEGYVPVIAHPERNEMVQRNPSLIYEFVEMGALCQIDAGSLTGDFGMDVRAAALHLVAANAAHVVASDGHDTASRKPVLAVAEKVLARFGTEKTELLFRQIPRSLITNVAPPDIGPLGGQGSPSLWKKKLTGWLS